MSGIIEQVSAQIREARKTRGFTQKEMGDKLGVTEGAYSRYESGKQNLTLDTISKICDAMGVELKVVINF